MKFRNSTRFTRGLSVRETCFSTLHERERRDWHVVARFSVFARDLFPITAARPSPWTGSHDLYNAEDYGRQHFLLFEKEGKGWERKKRDSDNARFASRVERGILLVPIVHCLCILPTNRRFWEGGIEGFMQINEMAYCRNSAISAI